MLTRYTHFSYCESQVVHCTSSLHIPIHSYHLVDTVKHHYIDAVVSQCMSHSALLWSDDHCNKERVYTFVHKGDFVEMLKLSIDRSTTYLERFVFCATTPSGQAYDIKAEQYALSTLDDRKTEDFLHRRVKYWKTSHSKIAFDLYVSLTLGHITKNLLDVVQSYL